MEYVVERGRRHGEVGRWFLEFNNARLILMWSHVGLAEAHFVSVDALEVRGEEDDIW